MGEARLVERLTASDLFMLLWDDYGWPNQIGGLAILDGASLLDRDGHLRIEAVRQRLEPRLHLVPRFRQLLYRPRLGLGWPLWVDAPSFDLADHVRVHPLAAPGGQAQLLGACQQLARRRLDPARPLWELWLLPGLPQRRVGAYLKLHHVAADGPAALAAFGALLDLGAEAPTPVAPPWTPTPIPTASELLRDNLRRRRRELGRGWSGLAHPGRTLRRARVALPAWREVLVEQPAPRTSLNHLVGADRRLAIVRGRLDLTRQVAHLHHAKVNDVVLAAVAGGLRQLLGSRGEDVGGLVLRAMVPISLHQEQARGNKPGWMMVPLPVGEPDPVRRLELIAAQTAARTHKARPQAGTGIFRFVAGQRAWYRHFPRQRSVNLVVTNVPGPPVPLYLAGARLLELFPMVPVMGNLTLVVAVLSYAGQLNLTAMADRDGCPDVEVFAQGLHSTLDDLARTGGLVTVTTSAISAGEPSRFEQGRSNVGSAQS
ncbi:MAG TPA: wax ester/triacylglycerol synthase family O-acyltransferase [Actinomycetes bacterium]|jgi:WS/DGAT/MGAT family acyltransferase|nr:wax ester/triacylglycerol synthase family O-acyltransferase [Actinomycetes bacterium]